MTCLFDDFYRMEFSAMRTRSVIMILLVASVMTGMAGLLTMLAETGYVVCTPFDRTGSLVALSTEAKKFSWGEEFQA